MKLLLISNSTNAGEAYLEYPKQNIAEFLEKYGVKNVLFIPYAAVTFSYDDYQKKVQERFAEFSVVVDSVHLHENPVKAVEEAEAIVIGGGNTFHLLKTMQDNKLIEPIRKKIQGGTPYIGWSAGSNVTCPTICTTNDMPIVEPQSFEALNLIPFQVNPHYLDAHPDGHAGETREQRIMEYIAANQDVYVAGLREGCMFLVEEDKMSLIGPKPVRLFKYGEEPREMQPNEHFSQLLQL